MVAAIEAEHARLQTVTPTTELGTATLSVTMIEGGTGANVIPAACSLVASRRTVPGEEVSEVYEQLAELAARACPLPIRVESLQPVGPDGRIGSNAFYEPADTPLVDSLAEWAGTRPTVAPFGTNALRYGGLARELAVFGPGSIDDAHQATERVAVTELVATAEVFTRWLNPG